MIFLIELFDSTFSIIIIIFENKNCKDFPRILYSLQISNKAILAIEKTNISTKKSLSKLAYRIFYSLFLKNIIDFLNQRILFYLAVINLNLKVPIFFKNFNNCSHLEVCLIS